MSEMAAMLAGLALMVVPGAAPSAPTRPPVPVTELVFHAERPDGSIVASQSADRPMNPASLIKIATSTWALARLGPEFRFETGIGVRGALRDGIVDGDLIISGGGDPDFQVENAFLVAAACNHRGVHRVRGRVLVNGPFWIGWEHGRAGGSEEERTRRAGKMTARLTRALDPSRWDGPTRQSWEAFRLRRRLAGPPPAVVVEGATRQPAGENTLRPLLVHRSGSLLGILRRFDAWSNNDINRLAGRLGPAADLAAWLDGELAGGPAPICLATLSGQGRNRMSMRQIVALVRLHVKRLDDLGLPADAVLPVAGCSPGTLTHHPGLGQGDLARAIIAKTGTLSRTDGGVVALAGVARTPEGELFFGVALPAAAGRVTAGRRALQAWVQRLVEAHGGPAPAACGTVPGFSDQEAAVAAVPSHPAGASSLAPRYGARPGESTGPR
ncbi:MAG: D-alanyl-D-alanine carboxypeptidase [Acidobacteriota bacterium]